MSETITALTRVYANEDPIIPEERRRCNRWYDESCVDCSRIENDFSYYKAESSTFFSNKNPLCCRDPSTGIIDWGFKVRYTFNLKNFRFLTSRTCLSENFDTSNGKLACITLKDTDGNEIKPEQKWSNNIEFENSAKEGRTGSCIYKIDDFLLGNNEDSEINVENILKWKDYFVDKNPEQKSENARVYNEEIMPYVCFNPANPKNCSGRIFLESPGATQACPRGLQGCSILNTDTPLGQLCQDWKETLGEENPIIRQEIELFCTGENSCAFDCLCFNRQAVDPVYRRLATTGITPPTEDACWYRPCQLKSYFKPTNQLPPPGSGNSISVNGVSAPQCPDTVCLQITTALVKDGSELTLPQKNEISCDLSDLPSGSDDQNGSDDNLVTDKKYENYFFICGIAVLVVIVSVIVIILISIRRK